MLKDHQDAFGHAVHDYLHDEGTRARPYQIVERDDGLVGADNLAGYFCDYRHWPSHEKGAMRYVRGRVLDIGVGAGRVSLYLQGKGFDVVGIDNSPLSLQVCEERGLRNVSATPVSRIGKRLGVFDTVLMLGNNFGLFGSREGARRLLGTLADITSARGRIVADSNDIYRTDVAEHLSYHELNRNRGRMAGQLKLRVRYRKYVTPWFDYLQVSKQELVDILDGTAWKVAAYIDSARPLYTAIIDKQRA